MLVYRNNFMTLNKIIHLYTVYFPQAHVRRNLGFLYHNNASVFPELFHLYCESKSALNLPSIGTLEVHILIFGPTRL